MRTKSVLNEIESVYRFVMFQKHMFIIIFHVILAAVIISDSVFVVYGHLLIMQLATYIR